MQKYDIKTFQGMILALQDYWAQNGCTIVQPLDMEVGAGTSHPMTCLRALGPEPMSTAMSNHLVVLLMVAMVKTEPTTALLSISGSAKAFSR